MENKLHDLLEQVKQLEQEIASEIQTKGKQFLYEIRNKKIHFVESVKSEHRRQAKSLSLYFYDARFLHILIGPVIWICLIPTVVMDMTVMVYQAICFPIYNIPKVRRGDYLQLDHKFLSYLNLSEKINCIYCSYFNGLVGFLQEVGARTEQYWCPIKHASIPKVVHSRYKLFIDYGDTQQFREKMMGLRKSFDDLK